METTWLLLDCNYLARRAYHAMGTLTHNDIQVAVVYGFIRDVVSLQDLFATDKVVFCWDFGRGLRERICPTYKQARRDKQAAMTEEERASIAEFRDQVARLRTKYLRGIGYRNILWEDGYEADDIIAGVLRWSLPAGDHAVIVSSDHDYYQLLGPRCTIYNPAAAKTMTEAALLAEYGVTPRQWVDVKALAGCSSDSIAGVAGVGEKTAAKWVRGELKQGSKTHANIATAIAFGRIQKNKDLIRLPYKGCPAFELADDEVTLDKWQAVMDRLGFRSLRGSPPMAARGQRPLSTKGLGL